MGFFMLSKFLLLHFDCNFYFMIFFSSKIFVKSIEHLELRVGELAVPVLVGKGEHLLDVVIRDTDRQVLHDVHKVGLGKVVAQYRAI